MRFHRLFTTIDMYTIINSSIIIYERGLNYTGTIINLLVLLIKFLHCSIYVNFPKYAVYHELVMILMRQIIFLFLH